METAAQLVLMYVVVPLLVLAGLADWAFHRHTGIEVTSGLKENQFHWLLFAQGGLALGAAAFLEGTAAVLLLVFAAFLAHQLTTWAELHYTAPRRLIAPGEQMVHSFMELLPLATLLLLGLMHWEQALSLLDESQPDFGLRWKDEPWPAAYLLTAGVAILVCNILPLAEESWRCLRARKNRR